MNATLQSAGNSELRSSYAFLRPVHARRGPLYSLRSRFQTHRQWLLFYHRRLWILLFFRANRYPDLSGHSLSCHRRVGDLTSHVRLFTSSTMVFLCSG